jgi:hypothetical protein
LPSWIDKAIKEAATQFPTLVICLGIVYFAYSVLSKAHKSHLESKDKEIERLVREKNSLQELVLKNRLSTKSKKK